MKRQHEDESRSHLPPQGLPMVPIPPQRSQFVNNDNAYRVANIFDENDARGFQTSRKSRSQQNRNQQQRHRPGQRSRSSLTQFGLFSSKIYFFFSFYDKNCLLFFKCAKYLDCFKCQNKFCTLQYILVEKSKKKKESP